MIPPTTIPDEDDLLVVDDDLPSLRALSSLLKEEGYQVRSARDGASALMMVNAEPPDLILLDIRMPGMDGFQVCETLKRNTATRHIPVLFISAEDEVQEKVKSFDVGGVDYITKPFREEEVLARLRTHLTIAKLNEQLRETNLQLQKEIHEREQLALILQRRLEEFSALHEIAKTLTARQDLQQALESIFITICDLFGARLALIARLDEAGSTTESIVGHDQEHGFIAYSASQTRLEDFPRGPVAIAEGRAQVIENLQQAALASPIRAYVNAGRLTAGLVVPLMSRRIAWALLLIAKEGAGARFSQYELILAETIAADIAAAIENERFTSLARQAAVNAERQRLARGLHDSVTQSIYSLTLLSSGWESMARQGTLEDPADSFHRLGEVGQQALRDLRLLIHQMRPSELAERGLVGSLEQRLESVERRTNIEAVLRIEGELAGLPHKTEEELYFIAQEALNNSLRHARAGLVQVSIYSSPGAITLIVEDDGCGFDPSAKHTGMGLGNMQERALSIAGKCQILSEPGHGTRVTVSVPLREEMEQT